MCVRVHSLVQLLTVFVLLNPAVAGSAAALEGRVYEGQTGTEPPPLGGAKALPGVTVSLYGSDDAGDDGTGGLPIQTTTTNSEGWYSLTVRGAHDYYNIVQTNLATHVDSTPSPAATSVGGTVKSSNWIQYRYEDIFITPVTMTGNKFWDKPTTSGNNPPVAVHDSVSTSEGLCLIIDALANDSDPDGDLLIRQGYTQPSHGMVAMDAFGYLYCPDAGYTGTDTFEYTISDGNGGTDTATVTITVELVASGTGMLNGYKRDADTGAGLANWKIYVDENSNGACDPGEPFDLTDSNGYYEIPMLEDGTYRVCEVMQDGWEPASGASVCVDGVAIVAGMITTQDFHNRKASSSSYEYDFGDAPDAYGTLEASNGPKHIVSKKSCLGSQVDGESDGQPSANATGDDVAGVNDDDGVTWLTPLTPGGAAQVRITATVTDQYFRVLGWIDFNQNNSWLDSGEKIVDYTTPGSAYSFDKVFTFNVPASAATGQAFARFRVNFIYTTLDSPTGAGDVGEVEDYLVEITDAGAGSVIVIKEATPQDDTAFQFCADYAPGGFFTTLCQDLRDPSHNQWLLFDMDRLKSVTESVAGGWTLKDITITGDTDNGSVVDLANAAVDVDFDAGEDIVITFKNERTGGGLQDHGDAPASYGDAWHTVDEDLTIGGTIDAENNSWCSSGADGDDNDGIDDETGVTIISPLTRGAQATLSVEVFNKSSNDVSRYVAGWIDFDGNGQFDLLTDHIGIVSLFVPAHGAASDHFTFFVPQNAQAGNTIARFRLYADVVPSTVAFAALPTGDGGTGEVEDYQVHIISDAPGPDDKLDYGDAPYASASHNLGGPWLGNQPPDAEMGTLSNPPGWGDDNTGTDDEDGAQFLSDLVPGQPFGVSWKSYMTGPAVMVGWIDLNRDGDWDDPGEYLGGTACSGCNWMMMTIQKPVPAGVTPGKTYARFRVFSGMGGGALVAPSGHGGPGEVEDYEVEIKLDGTILPPGEIVGGVKFNDANGNKVSDASDQGLANWTVWIDLNANGVKDAGEATLTNPDGTFYFMALSPGIYTVYEEMQPGWHQTCPGGAGTQTITVQAGQPTPSILFGNQLEVGGGLDYGDAPYDGITTFYPSANHQVGGPWWGDLSDLPDVESGMQRNNTATGDDADSFGDDEDGLFGAKLVRGQSGGLYTRFVPGGSGDVTLGAWVDFNGDGDWDDAGESSGPWAMALGPIPTGGWPNPINVILPFAVPTQAQVGQTFARLRIEEGLLGSLSHTGPAGAGEVEDHLVQVTASGSPGSPVPTSGTIWGTKFQDLNGNGTWEVATEPVLSNWMIWLDSNYSGGRDAGDMTAQTDSSGMFQFSGLATGTYLVGEDQQAGWLQTWPTSPQTHTVTIQSGAALPLGILFGNMNASGTSTLFDWGDAPDSNYLTLRASNGAYHAIVSGVHLGASVDAESDGQPTPNDLGDDQLDGDDEDGVFFLTPLLPGEVAVMEILASTSGYVDAWIDFDGDGTWNQLTDQILTSEPVTSGSNMLSVAIPASARLDIPTHARFRFSSQGGLSPDGPASDGEVEDYHVLVGGDGPVVPGEGEMPHVKWSQPPIEIDPNVETPPVFCGWDEAARSTQQGNNRRQWRMDADDFRCLGSIPVTRIRWWGGYKAWQQAEPPESQPERWHIGFWANQVEGLEPNELYLEWLVWSVEVPNERVLCEPVGLDEFPGSISEMSFVYELQLEPEEWFHQAEFVSNDDIYWISVTAVYPPNAEPINQWGWKTRPCVWRDGAVMPAIMGEWPSDEERLFPGRLYPVERSALCGQNQPFDLCFELLTEPPWIKWDQPFTSLRNWPHYDDYASFGLEDPNGVLRVSRRVVDDWVGEYVEAPVIAMAWEGSYLGYGYEPRQCDPSVEPRRPDYFQLSIRTNAPADSEISHDHPGGLVWRYEAFDYDEVLVGYDRHPGGEPNEPVFRYSVRLPRDMWFWQEGDLIYWFSVVAVYRATADEIEYPWGWTNHEYRFGSVACSLSLSGQELVREPLHNTADEPVDMSFTLYTTPEPWAVNDAPPGMGRSSTSTRDSRRVP
ncbi:MAG: cadherin-like domain-containing protein [Phycisphaerae bacterium]|nr:cadherin-like domain-containing protein [Phycisphaerae bacterium]